MKKKMNFILKKQVFFSLLVLFFGFQAYGQEGKKSAWKAELGLGAFRYTGNTDKFDFHTNAQISHTDSTFEYSSFLKAAYGETSGRKNKQEYSGGVKFDYKPHSTLSPFLMFKAYTNRFKDIDLRFTSLAGLKYRFYESEKADYSISAAMLYDIEKYHETTPNKEKTRVSFRPKIKQHIGENIYFEHFTFFMYNVQDWQDYIIESHSKLSVKVNSHFSLSVKYEYNYESRVANESIKNADSVLLASITFHLR